MPFIGSVGGSRSGRLFSIGAKPSQVLTPTSSSSDKSFSLSWDAPNNNGSPIIEYRVQYSTDGGSTWSSVATTQSTSYTFTVANGLNYIGRVIAYNAVGESIPSPSSISRVPVFTSNASISATTSAPTTSNRGYRSFTVTVDPPNVAAFSHAVLQTKLSTGAWTTRQSNITNIGSTSYTYDATASEVYSARIITYNTDGYSETTVISSDINIPALVDDSYDVPAFAGSGYHEAYWDSPPYAAYYTYSYGTYTSSTVQVNANTYSITSAYVGGPDRRTDSLKVYAKSTTGTATVCTSSRYFSIAFSFNTTGTYTNYSQLVDPFSTNSGSTVFRSRTVPEIYQGFDGVANNSRIQIRGDGSIASGWSPTISVYFEVDYTDRTYVPAFAGSGYHAAYWDNPPYDAYRVTQSY
jgi:hypothetical protein